MATDCADSRCDTCAGRGCHREPVLKRLHGAIGGSRLTDNRNHLALSILVGLRLLDADLQAFVAFLKVPGIERHEFGAAKRAGKTEEEGAERGLTPVGRGASAVPGMRAGPLLEDFRHWLDQHLPLVPPQSALGKVSEVKSPA